jgi:hypothetical protein
MSRRPNGSGRYYVTLEGADADALEAAARDSGRPPTTEAGLRIVRTLRADEPGGNEAGTAMLAELAELKRQLAAARAEVAALRRRLGVADGGDEARPPRWEWPLEDLLADRDWWAAWIPRLYEVLGRPLAAYNSGGQRPHDERGFVDLLSHLFPPVQLGERVLSEWHSPDYPAMIRRHASDRLGDHAAGHATVRQAAADVWQPVIRRVAVALSALEQTAAPGADPLLRIRTEEELTGPWLRTLRRLTGDEKSDLPGGGGPMK